MLTCQTDSTLVSGPAHLEGEYEITNPPLQFGDDDNSSNGSNEDIDSLPYPKPLKRSDFLAPNFSATEYLSSLQNRHQTLEDLRSELRTRSQDLNKELLDLVNHNYKEFLGLGSSLKGGDEKVEEVRLGLLGFRRDVETLRTKVDDRRGDTEDLLVERKEIRKQTQIGRQLLELNQRIEELEQRLLLTPKTTKSQGNGDPSSAGDGELDSDSDSEDDGEDDDAQIPLRRLRRRVEKFLLIRRLAEKLGTDQPFVAKQENRILQLRRTLLLDMSSTLKTAVTLDDERGTYRLFMLETYKIMDEANEAMKVLKETNVKRT